MSVNTVYGQAYQKSHKIELGLRESQVSDLENLKTFDETEEVESSESLEITETELEILETEAAEEE